MTRPLRWLVVVLGVALAAVLVVAVLVLPNASRAPSAVQGLMVATASSSSLGYAPSSALAGEDRTGWEPAGEAVGSWWQVALAAPARVSRISVGQATGLTGRTSVMLRFSDGSKLMTRLDGSVSRIEFLPRTVRSVRIDVLARSGTTPLRLVGIELGAAADDTAPRAARDPAAIVKGATASADGVRADGLLDPSAQIAGPGWVSERMGAASILIRFARAQEIAGLGLTGSASGGPSLRGDIVVGGDRVRFGNVLADPSRPTQIAFPPHAVRSLRIDLVGADPAASVRLTGVTVLPSGRAFSTPAPDAAAVPRTDGPAPSCRTGRAADTPVGFVLRCPAAGAALNGRSRVVVDTPVAVAAVDASAWDSEGGATDVVVEALGPHTVAVDFDASRLAPGPVSMSLRSRSADAQPQVLSFDNVSTRRAAAEVARRSTIGGRLVYSEEFARPVSASFSGDTGLYTSAKPEIDGASSFGDAPFTDPSGQDGTLRAADGMLRLDVRPGADGGQVGAMLASSRSGGSGFSAQYGYFEARMQMPIAKGSWGAFWVLPSSNLVVESANVAEFDATEIYGHDPTSTCSTTHRFQRDAEPTGQTFCGQRWPTVREASQWHTYGLLVLPGDVRFFLDGKQVAVARQVPGGSEPMFFMADLALGGGWPVDLAATSGRLQAYVDWIRVYE